MCYPPPWLNVCFRYTSIPSILGGYLGGTGALCWATLCVRFAQPHNAVWAFHAHGHASGGLYDDVPSLPTRIV